MKIKNFLALALIAVCSLAIAQPYFGAYHEEVHETLHPSRNILEDTLKAIGTAVANSPNWTGTNKQAHNLVRRTVIIQHGVNVPQGTDLDAEPTEADKRAARLRRIMIEQGYSEADADSLVTSFMALTHPE